MTEISDKKIVKMTRLVVLCSAILSSLLDNIEQEDHVHSPPFDGRSKSRNDGQHIYTIVLMLVLNIVALLWIQVKFWASSVGSERKPHAEKARVASLAHVFLTVVVPIIFIKRKEKLKKFCVEYFRK